MISSAMLLLLSAACFLSSLPQGSATPPACPSGSSMTWLADDEDCSKFYVCHGAQRFNFDCGENVWDQDTRTCVGRGSQWDKCTIAKQLDTLNGNTGSGSSDPCANSVSGIFAKADNCGQFYDCSSRQATVDATNPHVVECKYPFLFNEDSKRCEHYSMVKCGSRKELLDGCDYVANHCRHAHCMPCNVRFPSCRNMPDGLNPWVGREYSPFFVVCQNQRALYQDRCNASLFDPVNRVCSASVTDNGSN